MPRPRRAVGHQAAAGRQGDADKEQHVRKLTAAQNINMIIGLFLGDRRADSGAMALLAELESLARVYHQRKNRSLYVDWYRGTIAQPADVGEAEAASTVTAVRSAVSFVNPLVRATVALHRQGLTDAPTAHFLDRAARALADGDAGISLFADQELATLGRSAEPLRSFPLEVLERALRDMADQPEPGGMDPASGTESRREPDDE